MTENEEEIKFESNFESGIRTNDGFDNALFVILIGIAVLMAVLYLLNLCSCCFRSTKKTKKNDYGTLTALKMLSFIGVVIGVHILTNKFNAMNKESLRVSTKLKNMDHVYMKEAMELSNAIDCTAKQIHIVYNDILLKSGLYTVGVIILSVFGTFIYRRARGVQDENNPA